MNPIQRDKLQQRKAWSILDELYHIHRELARLLPIVVKSPKTEEWNPLLRHQREEDEQQRRRLAELAMRMGHKPAACVCPKAVELLADVLLAHRTQLRKNASGGLVIQALRQLRSYTEELWSELSPLLQFRAPADAADLVLELRDTSHALLAELPAVHRTQLSSGGLRSLKA